MLWWAGLALTIAARVYARHGEIVVDGEVVGALDVEPAAVQAWKNERMPAAPTNGKLDCDSADHLFPLRIPLQAESVALQGWLLVGRRPDGSIPGKIECEALAEIAGPITHGLAISRARQAEQAERTDSISMLRGLVAGLQVRLERLETSLLVMTSPLK